MTLTGPTYAEAVAWVEQLVTDDSKLQSTKYNFYTLDGHLWVQVQGGRWEAHAWQVALGGRIMAPHIDKRGVRRQLIIGQRASVEVIDDPSKRDETGGATTGMALIVACVGLFLWGFQRGTTTPDGRWLAAVLIVGVVLAGLVAAGRRYRENERRSAAYTAKMEGRLEQDETGAHILDGA